MKTSAANIATSSLTQLVDDKVRTGDSYWDLDSKCFMGERESFKVLSPVTVDGSICSTTGGGTRDCISIGR